MPVSCSHFHFYPWSRWLSLIQMAHEKETRKHFKYWLAAFLSNAIFKIFLEAQKEMSMAVWSKCRNNGQGNEHRGQCAEGVESSSTTFHIARLNLWRLLLSSFSYLNRCLLCMCSLGFSCLGQVCVWVCLGAHVKVRGHLLAPPAHWPSVFWSILCFSLPSYHWGMKGIQMLAPLQLAVLWTLLHTEWSPGLKHDFHFVFIVV